VLAVAASAESASEHPLARAIEDAATGRGIDVVLAEDFQSHTGKGVEATVEDAPVLVGTPGFLDGRGIDLAEARDRITALEEQGLTVVDVAHEGRLLGLVGIGDEVKPDAAETIRRMNDAGIIPVMITGDNRRTAEAVAAAVGIERVLAEVLPEDKATGVRRLQRGEDGAIAGRGSTRGQRVMMVGDGINDAPALTQADVGIAIGAGTDIAIESADIVIMTERLGAVMDARDIGVRSYAKTKQNLSLAFAFNGIGVPAAATGLVHPIWAMIAMVASVTAVLINSFAGRLLRRARGASATGPHDVPHGRDHHGGGTGSVDEADHVAAHHHTASAGHGEAETAQDAAEADGVGELRLQVPMHCGSCSQRIEDRIGAIDGVRDIHADHDADTVTIRHTSRVFEGQIRTTLHGMGFDVAGHVDDRTPR
jgi:cation transport ATPase